jgi:hypothetical protein
MPALSFDRGDITAQPGACRDGLGPAGLPVSSYRRNAGGGANTVVTEHAEYTALGGLLER